MPQLKLDGISSKQILARDTPVWRRAKRRGAIDAETLSRLSASTREFKHRQSLVPTIRYQSNLPINPVLPEISGALAQHQVVVVAGETGSGKTTQLPLACLKAGLGIRGMIGHTQPRRLAARAVANRLAEQLNSTVGAIVGFAVRFDDQVSSDALVKVMTDGLLLTEIRRDRLLYAYDTVIVDEAHERSLNIDFLLGYLKKLLVRRKDLRVIVTSATIDVEAFSHFFDNAPIFVVEGRSFPIETRYRPLEDDAEQSLFACLEEIEEEPASNVQDVLVFLPGEREIFEWAHWLRKTYSNKYEVLPLYARLPAGEQRKIFAKSAKQRILLATNVAETSLTVPNVRYVIDFGTARICRFSLRSRIQRLPVESISQASANQRAGRCGRVAPGVCFRLYSEADFLSREAYTEPQIKRTNLASVVLHMIMFGYGEIGTFPFLDRPDDRAVSAAKRLLHELGALRNEQVTEVGKQMARIPVDPRLARMLVEANNQHALKELLIIVSALAVQDPFMRPLDRQQAADQAHSQFRHPKSDFISYLKLWDWVEDLRNDCSWNELRRSLERSFVSSQRYLEWRALHRQLLITCKHLRFKVNKNKSNFEKIHKSILSGSLGFLGLRQEHAAYQGVRNLKFWLFPGSVLAVRKPKWIVASTIVETSRVYARGLAEIKPNWIEPYAESITSSRVHDHYWDATKNDSRTNLDISIYGLPIVQNRKVRLKDYDLLAARELFLSHALVRDQANLDVCEITANYKLRCSLLEIQSRERRSDVVIDEDSMVDIYRSRVPDEICDRASFLRWYRTADATQQGSLRMRKEDLLQNPNSQFRHDDYPAEIMIGTVRFPLRYKFGPGQIDDGVSLVVPLENLPILKSACLDWIVPGFFEEKCLELLRGLPKQYRKQLAPIPDKVNELVPLLLRSDVYRVGHLAEILSQRIRTLFHVQIESSVWGLHDVSTHLLMNVQISDNKRKIIDQGRNLPELRQRVQLFLQDRFDDSFLAQFEQRALKEFPLTGLPRTLTATSTSGTVTLYPFLTDRGDSIDLTVRFDEKGQYQSLVRGLSRLVLIRERDSMKYLSSQFNRDRALHLYSINLGNLDEFQQMLFLTSARNTFFSAPTIPETEDEFERIVASNRELFVPNTLSLMELVSNALATRHRLSLRLEALVKTVFQETRDDITQQLNKLFTADFPYSFSAVRLSDLSRYLEGIEVRLNRLSGKLKKDILSTREIARWQERSIALEQFLDESSLEELFHLLEEYRLSLFCPGLKTRVKMSPKRLEQTFSQWEHKEH